jgi:hypothetical protein
LISDQRSWVRFIGVEQILNFVQQFHRQHSFG